MLAKEAETREEFPGELKIKGEQKKKSTYILEVQRGQRR